MTLPDGVASAIIEHARDAAPHECCGLLIGAGTRVTAAFRARNIADEPRRRYRVDPHDHFAAIRLGRERKQQVIGAYHSHPRSKPVPSRTDSDEAFADFFYVIVGLDATVPEIRAWRWANGNFTSVPLVRVP